MAGAALKQLGRYRILAELGRGAMGIVYKAEDPSLNRAVAVKTIMMSPDAAERAEYEARFLQEAKAAGGLNHPNIIIVHDIGREGDIAYMAMELLEGVDLREVMKRGRIPPPSAIDIAAQVADGLAFAHEHGVIHRDIKPGNIMIVRGRHVKIMDFGIARMRVSDIKTQTGTILGSPRYMSPEQVTGRAVDHRSDIFSLGVVLYELASGTAPFSASQPSQLMYQVAHATPQPPSALDASLPAMLDLIVARALEKDPGARYRSAAEFAADLRACRAELAGERGPASTAVPERTVVSAADPGTTRLLETDGASPPLVGGSTDTGVHLLLSRRIDSGAALQRLVELGAAAGTAARAHARRRSALERLRQDPELLTFTGVVTAAAVAALAIALF